MPDRLEVIKTHKLFINGQFPRSESGRSLKIDGKDGEVLAHICHASRKDLRDAVVAARAAAEGWLRRSAYNRGQILYRMAEMLEGKRDEFVELIESTAVAKPASKGKQAKQSKVPGADAEITASIDRLISYAGWADKYSQVLGCNNQVNGPFYNFTVAEGTGVIGVVAPDAPALLGLITLIAPALCAGCTVVALGSEGNPLPTCVLGEVCATSDVPAGVINLLTGKRAELVPQFAEHRDIDTIAAANLPDDEATKLRMGAANNIKRVQIRELSAQDWYDTKLCESPWWVEPFVEMKTIWHPSAT